MNDTTPSRSLYDRTLDLVKNRPGAVTYAHIAGRSTGRGKFTPRWLEAFACGKIEQPSVLKVEELYRVLTGNEVFDGE